ncbi:hemerythrin domain-containing protein [Legionella longbeachae]|uniref:Hemerythrin-like domain-containing protein n=1 Tax=Legionella longbeachae serogroup 1 (strain NSW150) TaxID=661367 RepID=D3HMI3_LEGLN|nr:hemerythrin domain-containing protein [Legionella longbeachae]VEE04092.1 Uncharacterized conserved protein [Legionella oakridgensis]ARB93062.1 hemerythrin domain-containing protein [Legionella longbeachae]ARM33876.1 hemerythrin domain-containing protein [Legionella longbeachae]EEZ96937.1 conserved hypothetical protein [Legionella longbeachae D-4968]QIN33740.1 twin-arginine translocation signal domain-containing protein [Legionella longbeachae]
MSSELLSRRDFLKKVGLILGGVLITGPLLTKSLFGAGEKIASLNKGGDITPDEDLMREHGVLRRIILIYRQAIHRINEGQELNPAIINKSAAIIRSFIENYHEKLEENFIFPRFEKEGQLITLVSTLKTQHQVGRKLTDTVLEFSKPRQFKSHNKELVNILFQFINMYEPHAAREDTVLFPALRNIVSDSEYKEMGEQFEAEEHKLFGKSGFEGIVSQIAEIEMGLNIYELPEFTPE